jgi:uncharacterized protein
MRSKLLHEDGERTFVLVFDKGDEALAGLEAFAREHAVTAARLTGIGAFTDAKLGYYDRGRREYTEIPVAEQVEVLSLLGDVAVDAGEPKVHAHVVLGRADGTALGGHLLEATSGRPSRWSSTRRQPTCASAATPRPGSR